MRIGYVLMEFPPLTETFIRRETAALCRGGDSVFVYADSLVRDPLVPASLEPALHVREVPFQGSALEVAEQARLDGVEHLHGSLMSTAHRATRAAAHALGISYTVTAYSGRDIFTVREPRLYRELADDPLCRAIVVEDEFMRDWMVARFSVPPERLALVANSLDLDTYRLEAPRPWRDTVVILAIARFIKKKGLFELVSAFHQLSSTRDDAVLRLVGRGPHEDELRAAASDNPRIEFLGPMTEEQTRKTYADADVFCLPCVQTSDGNADGIPTVVLEAMAFELPVVTSDLLSMPCYVRDGREGLLVAPRDVPGIAAALDRLCADGELRARMGRAGRARVTELCEVNRNVAKLRVLFPQPPVRDRFLPFGAPCLGEEEIAETVDTLRSAWIGTGPKVRCFEEEFADYVGAAHAVAVSSCTAALFLSLLTAGVGPGDEVITTPLTFVATANVIEHLGAVPVFADVDPDTFTIDHDHVRRAIGPRTKAVIPVHFGGLACDLDALRAITDPAGVVVVDDAAHAVGALRNGRMVGGAGGLTAFSFYANKNLTTAEGGMITTDDARTAERLRVLRLHGLDRDAWRRFGDRGFADYEQVALGYKCNMTDLAASIGIHQLRKQERFFERRARFADMYDKALADLPLRHQHRPQGPDDRHALHLYAIVLEEDGWNTDRDGVVAALHEQNIGAAVHYRPVHNHRYYRTRYGYRPTDFPHAHDIGRRVVSLPLTPGMTDNDAADVIRAMHRIADRHAR